VSCEGAPLIYALISYKLSSNYCKSCYIHYFSFCH